MTSTISTQATIITCEECNMATATETIDDICLCPACAKSYREFCREEDRWVKNVYRDMRD